MKKLFLTVILLSLCSLYAFGQGLPWEDKKGKAKGGTQNQCVKKLVFGLDLGIGYALFGLELNTVSGYNGGTRYDAYEQVPCIISFDLAPRFTWNIISYFGIDFIKINGNFGLLGGGKGESGDRKYYHKAHYYKAQLLSGIRGATPNFFKCMSGYGAFRIGYGLGEANYQHTEWGTFNEDVVYYSNDGKLNGFCFEAEFGFNITRTFLVGVSYNHQYYDTGQHTFLTSHRTVALRVGFNFGK